MIVIGACNFGSDLTNHDIGGYTVYRIVKDIGGEFVSAGHYKYCKYQDKHKFCIITTGVNDLYKTIGEIRKYNKKEEILIVCDEFGGQIGSYKLTKFVRNGHNLCLPISNNNDTSNIYMLRLGINDQISTLGDTIFRKISPTNKQLISELIPIILKAIKEHRNMPHFIQIVKEEYRLRRS